MRTRTFSISGEHVGQKSHIYGCCEGEAAWAVLRADNAKGRTIVKISVTGGNVYIDLTETPDGSKTYINNEIFDEKLLTGS